MELNELGNKLSYEYFYKKYLKHTNAKKVVDALALLAGAGAGLTYYLYQQAHSTAEATFNYCFKLPIQSYVSCMRNSPSNEDSIASLFWMLVIATVVLIIVSISLGASIKHKVVYLSKMQNNT